MINRVTAGKTILLLCSLFLLTVSMADAGTIVAVTRSDISQYKLALDGFVESCSTMDIEHNIKLVETQKYEDESQMLDDIEKLQPVLIFTIGTKAAAIVKKRFDNVPVVYSLVLDPVKTGLIENTQRSGNNFTGVHLVLSRRQQIGKIIKFAPDLEKIAVIYDANISEELVSDLQNEAAEQGLKIILKPIVTHDQTLEVLKNVSKETDAIMAVPDGTVYTPGFVKHLLLFSLRNKYPVIGFSHMFAKGGALLSLYADYEDVGRQTCDIAIKILDGMSPSEIPSESPRSINVALNLKVADINGIKIPDNLIKEANDLIR